MRSFGVNGARMGWRLGAFVGMLQCVHIRRYPLSSRPGFPCVAAYAFLLPIRFFTKALEAKRDKDDVLNVTLAGGSLGCLFGVPYGPRAALGGALGGTVLRWVASRMPMRPRRCLCMRNAAPLDLDGASLPRCTYFFLSLPHSFLQPEPQLWLWSDAPRGEICRALDCREKGRFRLSLAWL